jgi:hypothetical protein
MTTIEDVSEPLIDIGEKRIGNLPFVIRSSREGEKNLGGMTILHWDGANPRVCDVGHKLLWNRLVKMYQFFEDHFGIAEPGVEERWALVRDFVLKGEPLDASLYDQATED